MGCWLGQPHTQRERGSSIDEGKDFNVSVLQMSLHTGTHMDAPLHFFKDGTDITTAPFKVIFGAVRVTRIKGERVTPASLEAYEVRGGALEVGECLFFKTDNSAWNWPEEPFNEAYIAHHCAYCCAGLSADIDPSSYKF